MLRIACCFCLLALAGAARAADRVPSSFFDLYLRLEGQLSGFEGLLRTVPASAAGPSVFSATLLTADANRGFDLLGDANAQGIALELARLNGLGVQAITVSVQYPLLSPSYWTWFASQPGNANSTVDYRSQFVAAYQRVIADARSRGMRVVIEMGPIFTMAGTADDRLGVGGFYRAITTAQYIDDRARMAASIARELAPDWLTVSTEPDTEQAQTGHDVGSTPAIYASTIAKHVASVRGVSQVPIGAGIGTWNPTCDDLITACLSAQVDYLDMHLYPLDPTFVQRAFAICARARAAGKRAAISEAWLYKERASEQSGVAATNSIFARDAFGFWQPLDTRFMRDLALFARAEGLAFVSPFWVKGFYAYLAYQPWMAQPGSAQAVLDAHSTAAATALANGSSTTTGQTWGAWAVASRPSAAPAQR